jgi:hypothetical protein
MGSGCNLYGECPEEEQECEDFLSVVESSSPIVVVFSLEVLLSVVLG